MDDDSFTNRNNLKEIAQYITLVLVIAIIGFSLFNIMINSDGSLNTETTLGKTEQASTSATPQEIDGVQVVDLSWGKFNYNPNVITVAAGKPVRVVADLERLQGCFRSFVIRDLGISTYFSASKNFVEFTPTEKGSYRFSCSMGMGKGTLIVQ